MNRYLVALAQLVQLVEPLKERLEEVRGRLKEVRDNVRAQTFWDIWKVSRGSELLLMKDRNFEVFSACMERTLDGLAALVTDPPGAYSIPKQIPPCCKYH